MKNHDKLFGYQYTTPQMYAFSVSFSLTNLLPSPNTHTHFTCNVSRQMTQDSV